MERFLIVIEKANGNFSAYWLGLSMVALMSLGYYFSTGESMAALMALGGSASARWRSPAC